MNLDEVYKSTQDRIEASVMFNFRNSFNRQNTVLSSSAVKIPFIEDEGPAFSVKQAVHKLQKQRLEEENLIFKTARGLGAINRQVTEIFAPLLLEGKTIDVFVSHEHYMNRYIHSLRILNIDFEVKEIKLGKHYQIIGNTNKLITSSFSMFRYFM